MRATSNNKMTGRALAPLIPPDHEPLPHPFHWAGFACHGNANAE